MADETARNAGQWFDACNCPVRWHNILMGRLEPVRLEPVRLVRAMIMGVK
jgi:hypothetical protein